MDTKARTAALVLCAAMTIYRPVQAATNTPTETNTPTVTPTAAAGCSYSTLPTNVLVLQAEALDTVFPPVSTPFCNSLRRHAEVSDNGDGTFEIDFTAWGFDARPLAGRIVQNAHVLYHAAGGITADARSLAADYWAGWDHSSGAYCDASLWTSSPGSNALSTSGNCGSACNISNLPGGVVSSLELDNVSNIRNETVLRFSIADQTQPTGGNVSSADNVELVVYHCAGTPIPTPSSDEEECNR